MANRKSESKSPSRTKRLEVSYTDTLIIAVQKLAQKHAQSGALLSRVVMTMSKREGIEFLRTVGELGFYGEDVWNAYSFCNSDIEWFQASILTQDPDLLKRVERIKVQRAAEILGIDKKLVQ